MSDDSRADVRLLLADERDQVQRGHDVGDEPPLARQRNDMGGDDLFVTEEAEYRDESQSGPGQAPRPSFGRDAVEQRNEPDV